MSYTLIRISYLWVTVFSFLRPRSHGRTEPVRMNRSSVSSDQTDRVYRPSVCFPSVQNFKTCFKTEPMDRCPIGPNRWLVQKSIGSKPAHAQNQVDTCLEALNLVLFSTSCVLRHRVLIRSDFGLMVCTHIRPSGHFRSEPLKMNRWTSLIGLVRPCVQGLKLCEYSCWCSHTNTTGSG